MTTQTNISNSISALIGQVETIAAINREAGPGSRRRAGELLVELSHALTDLIKEAVSQGHVLDAYTNAAHDLRSDLESYSAARQHLARRVFEASPYIEEAVTVGGRPLAEAIADVLTAHVQLRYDRVDKSREVITDDAERDEDRRQGGDGCVEVIRLMSGQKPLAIIYPTNAWID